MSAQGQALVTAPGKLVVAAPPVAALNNLIHKGSSFTGFLAVTADTVYADADGTMQATNGDTVEVWQSGALEMSYADNTDLERPVLTTSDPLVNGNSVLVFNNTSGPLTSITRSAGILAGHTGLTFIAVLKVTGGLSAGPPLGGRLNNTDNTFAADGTIDEWIGFENTRTLPVKFPLDRYALYAVRGGVTSGNTSVYINDPEVPIYTDTFSNAGFQTTVWIGGTHTSMTGNMVFLSLHKEEMPHAEFVHTVEAIKAVYNVVPTTLHTAASGGGGGDSGADAGDSGGGGGDSGADAGDSGGGGGDSGADAGDSGGGGDSVAGEGGGDDETTDPNAYDATMRVTMSNGTNHVSAYGPIGSDQVTYIPVDGPSENIIYIAPGSDAAYIQWPNFDVYPMQFVNPTDSFWNRTVYLAVAFEQNGWQELIGQGPNPAHGTDPGTYRLFGNIAGSGSTNGPVYFKCVTVEGLQQLGGNSPITYGAYNGGGIRVFTAYIGPNTQKCLINAQHIPNSPRTGLSLSQPPILSPMQIMNPFKGRLYDMRVYDSEHTDIEVQTTCNDIASALGVTL